MSNIRMRLRPRFWLSRFQHWARLFFNIKCCRLVFKHQILSSFQTRIEDWWEWKWSFWLSKIIANTCCSFGETFWKVRTTLTDIFSCVLFVLLYLGMTALEGLDCEEISMQEKISCAIVDEIQNIIKKNSMDRFQDCCKAYVTNAS